MELTIDNRKKEINLLYNLNLDYWDAIFWQNNKLQINNEKQIADIINKEAKSQLSYLLTLTKQPEFFIIDYHDNIFLNKFALFQVELLRMHGDDIKANFLENNLEHFIMLKAKEFSDNFFDEYKTLALYLKKQNFPTSFKVLILKEVLTYCYKINKGKITAQKRDTHKSITGVLDFSKESIEYIYNNAHKFTNFKDLYMQSKKEREQGLSCKTYSAKDVSLLDTFSMGHWLVFPSKKHDETHFEKNVQKLKALTQSTQWCTSTLARSDLKYGDFYIFLDNQNTPRIAIKLVGESVSEVRGIDMQDYQEVEPEYKKIALAFLTNNPQLHNAENWIARELWNIRLNKYYQDILHNTFTQAQKGQLLRDLHYNDANCHCYSNKTLDNLTKLALEKNIITKQALENNLEQ